MHYTFLIYSFENIAIEHSYSKNGKLSEHNYETTAVIHLKESNTIRIEYSTIILLYIL